MYDGDGKRISKTENGVRTNYYYEGGLLLYTTDEADKRISLNITGTESNVIAGVRYDDGESVYFYGKDIKGSTSCITDANGNVAKIKQIEGEQLIMKIYGYEKNGEDLLEMEETSIDCTLEELEKLIDFLNYVKESNYKISESVICHTHLRDWDNTWKKILRILLL